jgi:hypothetical protein
MFSLIKNLAQHGIALLAGTLEVMSRMVLFLILPYILCLE